LAIYTETKTSSDCAHKSGKENKNCKNYQYHISNFYKGNCNLGTAEIIQRKRRVPRNTVRMPLL